MITVQIFDDTLSHYCSFIVGIMYFLFMFYKRGRSHLLEIGPELFIHEMMWCLRFDQNNPEWEGQDEVNGHRRNKTGHDLIVDLKLGDVGFCYNLLSAFSCLTCSVIGSWEDGVSGVCKVVHRGTEQTRSACRLVIYCPWVETHHTLELESVT